MGDGVGRFLSRDLNLLVVFNALRNVTDLFLGTFLISFLMHLSTNEILSVSVYKLFEYAATCAGFFLFANWVKRYSATAVFALNYIPQILLLSLIIILGDGVVNYIMPLGMLYGIGAAMYHLPMHAMVSNRVGADIMGRFVGVKNAVSYTVKIIAPVVLGCFIDTGSYAQMSYALLVLSFIGMGLTFFLGRTRPTAGKSADFSGFCRCMMRFPIIRHMFFMEILRGFGLGLLGTVITMYTVYIFHTDLKLGFLTTVFAICSVLTCWCFRRVQNNTSNHQILTICMMAVLISMSLFVAWGTPGTFLLYNLCYSTAIVLMDQISYIAIYRLSQTRCVTDDTRTEYFVFHDFALFLGRWIGFVGLMYIGVFGGYSWLRFYLVLIGLAIILWGYLNRRLFFRGSNSMTTDS